jgi:hypothetical protein
MTIYVCPDNQQPSPSYAVVAFSPSDARLRLPLDSGGRTINLFHSSRSISRDASPVWQGDM